MARSISVACGAALALIAAPAPCRATMPTPLGVVAPEVRAARDGGLFSLPPRPSTSGSQVTSVQAVWNIPVVMVSFSDEPLQYSSAGFDSALFDSTNSTPTGSVYDYYRWVSENRMQVRGRVVARVQLAGTRAYYAAGGHGLAYGATPRNVYGALYEALLVCRDSVDWAPFDQDRDGYVDMLWFVHAGTAGEMSSDRDDFWSFTSRMSGGWRSGTSFVTRQVVPGTTELFFRIDRFATMPERSVIRPGGRIEIGVFCHEFGHALGLPDLYDTSTLGSAANVGPGNWSLMSTGGYGGNGVSPEAPTHVGGWSSMMLGWRDAVRPVRDTTITLTPLSRGGEVIEFWFEGQSHPEHFLLECRDRDGFDRTLNNGGLIVTHVDEAAIGALLGSNRVNAGPTPGLWLVEADGDSDLVLGRNRGDAYDPFPGLNAVRVFDESGVPAAVTFEGGTPGISLRNIQRIGGDVKFDLQVRPPGWLPSTDVTRGAYQPLHTLSLAPTAVRDDLGDLHRVQSEAVSGRSQVVLRSRMSGAWQEPLVLSTSPVGAVDPCLARIGDRDLAVAWSDLRGGRARVWFRARIRGVWSAEQMVGDLPGENRAPAMGADAQGRVHLTWLNILNDETAIGFTRFLYFAPWALSTRVTAVGSQPGAPVIAVAPQGTSHLIWPEQKTSPYRLYFSRFNPDTGLSNVLPFTPSPPATQGPLTAFSDDAGTLHVVWSGNNFSARELHYQRRPAFGQPSPRDTVIESRGATMEHLALASDPSGTLHLAFASAPGSVPQVFYQRWRPVFGWDVASSEITAEGEGDAVFPSVLPSLPGTVSVLYTSTIGEPRLMERRRQIEPPQIVLAAPAGESAPVRRLTAGPNPLMAGSPLDLAWEDAGSEPVADLYDLHGRRVASIPATVRDGRRFARLDGDGTRRLASGVYFVRPRGWSDGGARLVVLR